MKDETNKKPGHAPDAAVEVAPEKVDKILALSASISDSPLEELAILQRAILHLAEVNFEDPWNHKGDLLTYGGSSSGNFELVMRVSLEAKSPILVPKGLH